MTPEPTVAPACAECQSGTITMHSYGDRCAHANNVNNLHPYALRHDETLCGSLGAWFVLKAEPKAAYSAAEASK